MANGNFIVQNGLTVGPLTIDAATGSINTSGNVSITGSLGVSQISKNDSSVAINDTGTGSNVSITIDGTTRTTISSSGLSTPNTLTAATVNAATIGNSGATLTGTLSTAAQTNVTSVGTLTGLTLSGTLTGTTVNAATIGNTGAALTGTLQTAAQTNITSVGTLTGLTLSGTLTGTTVNAATIGNTGATLTGTLQTAAQTNITSVGTLTGLTLSGTLTGTTVNAATIGNTGAAHIGATVSAATIGNSGAALTGATLTTTSTINAAGTATVNALTSNGAISGTTGTFTGAVAGTSTANFAGAVTVASLSANADITVGGNLTVNGTTTTINSTTISVDDKNIELGSVASPTDVTADGGGITLKGATDKTFQWSSSASAWTSSEDISVATGKGYEINGTSVLNATTLGSGVTASSLTSVGTLTGLTISGQINSTVATGTAPLAVSSTTLVSNLNADLWDGNHFATYLNQAVLTTSSPTFAGLTVPSITHSGTDGVGNIGASGAGFNTVFAKATSAQYADLAEYYAADAEYEPGTVVCFGGEAEVTQCDVDACRKVAGVVSTDPAYIMNNTLEGTRAAVALQGRVPCKVVGPVAKGDMMVSAGNGRARAEADPKTGSVIGKALENFAGTDGVIEVVIGRV